MVGRLPLLLCHAFSHLVRLLMQLISSNVTHCPHPPAALLALLHRPVTLEYYPHLVTPHFHLLLLLWPSDLFP